MKNIYDSLDFNEKDNEKNSNDFFDIQQNSLPQNLEDNFDLTEANKDENKIINQNLLSYYDMYPNTMLTPKDKKQINSKDEMECFTTATYQASRLKLSEDNDHNNIQHQDNFLSANYEQQSSFPNAMIMQQNIRSPRNDFVPEVSSQLRQQPPETINPQRGPGKGKAFDLLRKIPAKAPRSAFESQSQPRINITKDSKTERRVMKPREQKYAEKISLQDFKNIKKNKDPQVYQDFRSNALNQDETTLNKIKNILLGFDSMEVIAYNGNEAALYCKELSPLSGKPQGFGAVIGVDYHGIGMFDNEGQILLNKNSIFEQDKNLYIFDQMPINPSLNTINQYAKQIYPSCIIVNAQDPANILLPQNIQELRDNKFVFQVNTKTHSFILVLQQGCNNQYELITLDNGSIPEVMLDPTNNLYHDTYVEYQQVMETIIKNLAADYDIQDISYIQINFQLNNEYQRKLGGKSSLFCLECCYTNALNILNNIDNIIATIAKDKNYKSNYKVSINNLAIIDIFQKPLEKILNGEVEKNHFITERKKANCTIKDWISKWSQEPAKKENLELLQILRNTNMDILNIVKFMQQKLKINMSLRNIIVNRDHIVTKNPNLSDDKVWEELLKKMTKNNVTIANNFLGKGKNTEQKIVTNKMEAKSCTMPK